MIENSPNLRIEICGGIASGKTSLATLLGQHGFQSQLENFASNPFFSDFYSNPSSYAFETEITFLLQHFSSIRASRQGRSILACDFSLALDLAYSQVTLSAEDQAVFSVVLAASIKKVGIPDLLIKLKCSADEELHRIRRRARKQEQAIDRRYLEQIELRLDRIVGSEPFSYASLLVIDSERTDFVGDSKDISQVLDEIQTRLDHLRRLRLDAARDTVG